MIPPCPPNSSGFPFCSCDSGTSGEIIFDYENGIKWLGICEESSTPVDESDNENNQTSSNNTTPLDEENEALNIDEHEWLKSNIEDSKAKFDPTSSAGIFLGYALESGAKWRGNYIVANLADFRGDEDSSDEEAWEAAQRRVDAEYVAFQFGISSLDDDIVEELDISESRHVRSYGGAPSGRGLGRRAKGRGKG